MHLRKHSNLDRTQESGPIETAESNEGEEGPPRSRLMAIADEIRLRGFTFVPGNQTEKLLSPAARSTWPRFAASWEDLGADNYMGDGGRYRWRRHAVFQFTGGHLERKPHQPHYQSRDSNQLNGGVLSWFDPVKPAVAEGAVVSELLLLCQSIFQRLEGDHVRFTQQVEMHQFRIEPGPTCDGRPTPEGVHRDGVEWVCVLLIDGVNVECGVTTIDVPHGRTLDSFTLQQPLDAVFLDDRRVAYGVTPIRRSDRTKRGYRDVLALTFDANVDRYMHNQ